MKVDKQKIIDACNNASSMAEAGSQFDINFQTFRKYAKELGVWKPNQAGVGIKRPKGDGNGKFALSDILEGKYPHYSSHKIRQRLIADGLKEDKCEECGIGNVYNGKPLSMHLDHIDGNHYNHVFKNLRILCPNCHSQTETHGSKKLKLGS
jgi:hypothetical protein